VSSSGLSPDVSRFSFDRLDTLVQVTTVRAWVYLAVLFAVSVAAVAFAVTYQVPTKVNGEGILLTEKDTLSQVRARATGRLVALRVKVGDEVAPGDEIGRISQDDLKDVIQEAESRLEDLRREDREFTEFEQRERENKEAAIARVKQTILRAEDDSLDKLKIAQRVVDAADRLRARKYLGDLDQLDARAKFYEIRDDLNKGQSRLAELELDRISAENSRRRAQLERRLKIRQSETKLALDRDKMERTSRVLSQARGQVAQVLTARDDLVREGAPVVLLHAPKSDRGADDSRRPYDSIIFVPAGEGKKIEPGHEVEVVPATVKREEHGFIRGRVVAISELPATKLAMEAALEHPELVDAFLKRYAPGVLLRVQVKLDEDLSRPSDAGRSRKAHQNPFWWSSSSGPAQPLKTGTMCQAAIVVQRRPLISLILPWTKKLVGVD
jgi:HlyD family secretion protein